jgi:preprotein translocase subunit SecD
MENQSDQAPKRNKPNPFLTILFVAAGIFIVLCGLIALGVVFYEFARPYFGPKSQAILAPDHSLVSTVNPADLEKEAQILTARSNALGARITFRVDGNNQIVAVGPASVLTRELINKTIAIGLLELVDLGAKPVMEGTKVATDFGYPYFPAVQGTKWHTVLTNAEFATVQVQSGSLAGQYQIAFTLTPSGRETLSDFTVSHTGQYLGIVMDKRVLSCPVIRNAITDGQGVIEGAFTLDSAESLAAYLRVRGPLPIPLEVVSFVEAGK